MADFDRVAHWYLPAERLALGWWLERTREFFLSEVVGCREAVLFGDGDGRFAAQLLAKAPAARLTAIDSSGAMLRLLARRCARVAGEAAGRRVRLRRGDARAWHPKCAPDLLVSHFFFDCLETAEIAALARRAALAARPGCLWLVSDFSAPRAEPWRTLGKAYIRLLYAGFHVLTGLSVRRLPAMREALRLAGFIELRRREFLGGLLFTSLWRLGPDATRMDGGPSTLAMSVVDRNHMSRAEGQEQTEQPLLEDAIPDPEPEVPSLPSPDPEVFEHEALPSAGPA